MTSPQPVSEVKHTPGPWTLALCAHGPDAPIFGYCVEAKGRVPYVASAGVASPNFAVVADHPHAFSPEECAANARLIAAAPDLLAALGDARQELRGRVAQDHPIFACIEAALLKATRAPAGGKVQS